MDLIEFMKWKRDYIQFPELFTEADEDEIRSWTTEMYEKVTDHIRHTDITSMADLCPWCILFGHSEIEEYDEEYSEEENPIYTCVDCHYGKRHGNCNNVGSAYHRLRLTVKYIAPEDIWGAWLAHKGLPAKVPPPDKLPCECQECEWSGVVSDCEIEMDIEGYEYPEYEVLLCPKCGGHTTVR